MVTITKAPGLSEDSLVNSMSPAYPIIKLKVEKVVGFESHEVAPGTTWKSGNLLFLNTENGASAQIKTKKWACASDDQGRAYLLWESYKGRANGLVLQPIDSRYCFEVFRA